MVITSMDTPFSTILHTKAPLMMDNDDAIAIGSSICANATWSPWYNTEWKWKVTGIGKTHQIGSDSSGTPGNTTTNRPSGRSAIANGSTTCVITNTYVTATTTRIVLTWEGDHGAARWWVTPANGSFTVTLSSAAAADTNFTWEIKGIL
jgi:hypothetical protein